MNLTRATPEYPDPEEVLIRGAVIEKGHIDESSRTVELSFSSMQPVDRWGLDEILDHSPGAVDLKRAKEQGVLLFNHNPERVLGRIEKIWIEAENKRGKAVVKFDDDPESDAIFRKVVSGTLKGVSVGYSVKEWESVGEKTTTADGIKGPAIVARKWEVLELTIAPVAADPTVGVGRTKTVEGSREEVKRNVDLNRGKKSEDPVDEEGKKTTAPEEDPKEEKNAKGGAKREDPDDEGRNDAEEEKERAIEIIELCRAHGIEDPVPFISRNMPIGEVRKAVLKQIAERQAPVPVGVPGGTRSVQMGADERDKFKRAAADGLCMRAGQRVEKPADGAENFRACSLENLAREALQRAGHNVGFGGDPRDIAYRALTTTDLPLIMADAANKALLASFEEIPVTWPLWCRRGSATDFKIMKRLRLAMVGRLDKMTESGEFKMLKLAEHQESMKIETYGNRFVITRQAIVNDDLSALTDIPREMGAMAAQSVNTAVYEMLEANPKMADGKELFHSSHSNLKATDSPITVETLSEARAAMRRQKNIGGKDARGVNIPPKSLLVPPELETTAKQLILSTVDPAGQNNVVNPFHGEFGVICDANLTNAKAWYLAADPSLCPSIEVAFLNGNSSPMIEMQPGWLHDGIEYRMIYDYGVAPVEYRGLYKNGA